MATAAQPKFVALSQKSSVLAAALGLLPPIGYIYTHRWIALIVSSFWLFILVAAATAADEPDATSGIGALVFLTTIICMIHNWRVVAGARKKLKTEAISAKAENLQDQKDISGLGLEILKLLKKKKKGQGTLADFILETHANPQKVQAALSELESFDAVRSDIRDSDGAVLFRIISS